MTVDEIQAKAHIARSFHCSKRHPYSSTHGKHSRYILQTEEHWSFLRMQLSWRQKANVRDLPPVVGDTFDQCQSV